MSRFIESIKLLNGQFHRLHYHQVRVERSVLELYQIKNTINLSLELSKQNIPKSGLYKCRIVYDQKIQAVEFVPYEPKPVKSLKVVHDQTIDYHLKFEDRSKISALFEQRQFCDDILIVKNGMVTDSSYANVIFFDGVKWITPKSPLLNGTMRQFLLDAAEIKEELITVQNIPSFRSFRLINAMLGFDGPEIDVTKIVL